MSKLAVSHDGNLYPARGEPGGGMNRKLMSISGIILIRGILISGLSGVGKQREIIRDT